MDIKTKEVVGIKITDETVSDHEKFEDLIDFLTPKELKRSAEESIGKEKIDRVLGDGGYDPKNIFNRLDEDGIKSGIKTRSFC